MASLGWAVVQRLTAPFLSFYRSVLDLYSHLRPLEPCRGPLLEVPKTKKTEICTLAMGCFWHAEAVFGSVPGVVRTRVGYTGGTTASPTYTSLGNHTETVEVEYDPEKTSLSSLLEVFFSTHDATKVKKDIRYHSAIFWHSDDQKAAADCALKKADETQSRSVRTRLESASTFHEAERYHQKYFLQNHPSLLKTLPIEDLVTSHVACRINGYLGGCGRRDYFETEWPLWGISKNQASYILSSISNK